MTRSTKVLDRRFFPAGTVVIEAGTQANCAYLIEKGRVEVFAKDASGGDVKLAEMGEKAIIGEMALLAEGPRSASVRTLEDTVLIVIPAHNLQSAMDASDSLFQKMKKIVISRAKDTHKKLMQKELNDAEKKAEENTQRLALDSAVHKRFALKEELAPFLERIKNSLNRRDKS